MDRQIFFALIYYLPGFATIYALDANPFSNILYFKRPKTEEEMMKLKAQYWGNRLIRNWDIDQYQHQFPPHYDLALRRQNYRQYYGDRYDGYKRYDV